MRCLAIAFCAVTSFPCALMSQDSLTNNILTTNKFRKGIYSSFRDFRDNSPTFTEDFHVVSDTGKFDRYHLYSTSKKKKIWNVYGFSDGEGVFINAQTYGQKNYFVRILLLGSICYFEDARAKASVIGSNSFAKGAVWGGFFVGAIVSEAAASHAAKNPGWVIYLPDDDGQPFILDFRTLGSILKEKDHTLFKEYEKLENKKDFKVIIEYVAQFNARIAAQKPTERN
ncbi:MAG: hypothetical protein ACKOE6_03690 [Flammeovirgaceae bacterium]